MQTAVHLEHLEWGEIAARLGAALILAGAVGLDRERKKRPAGLRTMMLVGVGSATFVIAGYEMTVQMGNPSLTPADAMSRVMQGIVGGIGFLGAGSLIHARGTVKGMTTAAAIWVTAALGITCGLGLYRVALLAGAGTIFTLTILRSVENALFNNNPPKTGPGSPTDLNE